MWLNQLRQCWPGAPRSTRRPRPPSARPILEDLEDRRLLVTFTASTVGDLIADIHAANALGGQSTINLTATTCTLTAVDNTTDGPTGLPVIAVGDRLTINGNGATIQRPFAAANFRLFDVASGAALTLNALTLQGGLAFGSGVAAEGGGIFSRGDLNLSNVMLTGDDATGSNGALGFRVTGGAGHDAAGGGIFAAGGSVTLEAGTFLSNDQAIGGRGGSGFTGAAGGAGTGNGGNGSGGAVFIAGGEVLFQNDILEANLAQGGRGGQGGAGGTGDGGGVFVGAGDVTLRNDTVMFNAANGGFGNAGAGPEASGEGGGIFIAGGDVNLEGFTLTHVINNTDSNNDVLANISP